MINYNVVKKLAKSTEWQGLYRRAEKIGTLQLFKNTMDLSKVQSILLYYLEIYHTLYQDLVNNEKYISEEVINDDIRCEAYLLYRMEIKNKEKSKTASSKREISNSGNLPTVIFKNKEV